MRRITITLLAAAPLAALLAGCSSSGGGTATAAAPTTPAASAPAPSPTESTGEAPESPPSSSPTGRIPRCHTADLKVSIAADEGGGAAGTEYETMVFQNRSTHTCTLYGYPGVSYVAGDEGTQVNDAFTRAPGTRKTVTLKAGAEAHASIGLPNYQNFPTADCKPVSIRGFRVYPPDETAAVFVSQPQTVCSVKGKGVGLVLPIEAGGGTGPVD
jgi:hypothetical protein